MLEVDKTMSGKVCLVTGGTSGIGRETALGLARKGAHVIIVGRDAARSEETAKWLKEKTGDNAEFLVADLSSQAQVVKLASAFKAKHKRLDVLVNNAGGVFLKRETTAEGFEKTWAFNHLAYFTLTNELLPVLKASSPSRIVSVSSGALALGKMDFENLQGEKEYKGFAIYGNSKLANAMFTYALARRLKGTGVTANCLHPGVVATGFGLNNSGAIKFLLTIFRPFLISPANGAKTSIYLASSPEVEGKSGLYFSKCKPIKSSTISYDEALQERLWQETERQTAKFVS